MLINNLMMVAGAFLISLLLVPWVKKLAIKFGAVDKPNARKVHQKLMPRMGGLAIYVAFAIMVLVTQPLTRPVIGLLLGSTIIVALGIIDDIKEISPKAKLAGQIVAAVVLVFFGIKVDFVTNPILGDVLPLDMLSIPVTIIWIVGITNAVNLIDGLDGLAAGTSAIAAFTMAIVGYTEGQSIMMALALILAASTLGFLKYNFHPATIFMGDTGSMFLGFVLSALAVMGVAKSVTFLSLVMPILVLGIPIFDTLFAIIRRALNGSPIFKADKEHLHHCLLNKGLTHRSTVLVIYAINIMLAVSGLLLTQVATSQGMLILVVVSTLILLGAQRIGVIGHRHPVVSKNVSEKSISK